MTKAFFIGVLVGGFIGAVAALLYAPQEGRHIRQQVSAVAHTAGARIGGIASDVQETVEVSVKAIKQAI